MRELVRSIWTSIPTEFVRRMPLVLLLRDKNVPTLDGEMLRLALGKNAITLNSDNGNSGLFGGAPAAASVDTARGELPTAPDGSLWLAYSGPHAERDISAAAIADKSLPADTLRGAIVYIGAPDDLVDTPMGPKTGGRSACRGCRQFSARGGAAPARGGWGG